MLMDSTLIELIILITLLFQIKTSLKKKKPLLRDSSAKAQELKILNTMEWTLSQLIMEF
jgi:hypothetical protein